MKVLVLHPPMYPVNYDFYNYLGRYVDLTIYQFGEYPSDHPNWTADELNGLRKNFNLKVFGHGSDSFKNQLYVLSLSNIKELQPDVILSIAFWLPSLYFSLIKKIFGFRLLILTNATSSTEKNNSLIRNLYRRVICSNTDCFISATVLTTDYMRTLCKNANIELSIQTIEMKNWREIVLRLPNKKDLRTKLQLPVDKVILLGVGNFIHKKNWAAVIKSIKYLEECIFVLIGSGKKLDEYLSYISKFNLDSKVLIINRKEGLELKEYYKAADIFILPSLYEQFGFVVPEALSSDLPVLCSKYTGASSLIIDGHNGYIIDPKLDFNRDIQNTINNLNSMKKNAYESVENLTLENRAKEFYTIFQKVVS